MGLFKSKVSRKKYSKYENDFTEPIYELNMFSGVGNIINEKSTLRDITNYFGMPDSDSTDERGNRILEYSKTGMCFKFLNLFNEEENPKVSFITLKKPFKKEYNKIYPGMNKEKVHEIMQSLNLEDSHQFIEVWTNDEQKHMKLVYDQFNVLDSIIIY